MRSRRPGELGIAVPVGYTQGGSKMEPFKIEFEVAPKTSYAPGRSAAAVTSVEIQGGSRGLVLMHGPLGKLGGIRLSPEDMDRLCKEWIDARRVCPFCKEPGMNVVASEAQYLEAIETEWECEHCGGDSNTQITPGSVPWVDPLGDTR
jgi:hypothetical protein